MIEFKSLNTKKLNKRNIESICKLKEDSWKFGMKSQCAYFKKNIKKEDIHNLIYNNKNLIGYTALRKRKIEYKNKSYNYLLLNSIVIKKKYRKKNFGRKIMEFNNKIIKNKKLLSILFCKSQNVKFFKKFHWKKISLNQSHFRDYKLKKNIMYFNTKKKFYKIDKIKVFVNN